MLQEASLGIMQVASILQAKPDAVLSKPPSPEACDVLFTLESHKISLYNDIKLPNMLKQEA